jgi:hypothetical protein
MHPAPSLTRSGARPALSADRIAQSLADGSDGNVRSGWSLWIPVRPGCPTWRWKASLAERFEQLAETGRLCGSGEVDVRDVFQESRPECGVFEGIGERVPVRRQETEASWIVQDPTCRVSRFDRRSTSEWR